jgi:GNAT superfamily N-acetyltransferase
MEKNPDISVQPALTNDIEFIVSGQLSMAQETENLILDPNIVNPGVRAVFNNPGRGFYVVAFHGETRCGCLMITPEWSDWRNAWVWWIQSVYVLPEFRKKGIFSSMYNYVRQQVSEMDDVSGIRLYVDISNISAQEVYSKKGMHGDHYRTFEWMK